MRLNQTEFAKLGGGSLRSQIEWEKGNAFPNAKFLNKIAEAGADVNYILTSVRYNAIANEPAEYMVLNKREQALLANYRAIDDEGDKRLIERTAQLAAEPGHIEVKQNKKGEK
ncbi:MAG: hypothetical protein CTY18_03040 [Methylomonas sp.]|nr:MAG: hypothetical protein CTY18_03040 [Methylomonas sp.]